MMNMKKYKDEYSKINGTRQDEPILNVVVNTNNTVICRKGPLVLDRIARNLGYKELGFRCNGQRIRTGNRYLLEFLLTAKSLPLG